MADSIRAAGYLLLPVLLLGLIFLWSGKNARVGMNGKLILPPCELWKPVMLTPSCWNSCHSKEMR